MLDSMQTVVARIRMLLRRVDDIVLPDQDIETVCNQLLRGYLQQRNLRIRDRGTQVTETTLSETELAGEYLINVPIGEFELEKLEYRGILESSDTEVRGTVVLVPLSTFNERANDDAIVGSHYGGNRIRLNLLAEDVDNVTWVITYRESLLSAVQGGQRPPLPSGHLPMLEHEAALLCMPLVDIDDDDWVAWMERTTPVYAAKLIEEKGFWVDYLETGIEPQVQPITRSDRHRAGGRSRFRPYVPAS